MKCNDECLKCPCGVESADHPKNNNVNPDTYISTIFSTDDDAYDHRSESHDASPTDHVDPKTATCKICGAKWPFCKHGNEAIEQRARRVPAPKDSNSDAALDW